MGISNLGEADLHFTKFGKNTTMTCTINSYESAKKVPFDLDGRILLTSDRCELIHLTLQAGETLALHNQPFDVIFFIIAGEGILLIGSHEIPVKSSTTVEIKTGVLRGWKNPGPSELKLLVIKLFPMPSLS